MKGVCFQHNPFLSWQAMRNCPNVEKWELAKILHLQAMKLIEHKVSGMFLALKKKYGSTEGSKQRLFMTLMRELCK